MEIKINYRNIWPHHTHYRNHLLRHNSNEPGKYRCSAFARYVLYKAWKVGHIVLLLQLIPDI